MSSILKPMFAYQGGKTKLASKIYNEVTSKVGKDITFVDVCCGGGSVSIELINNGLDPENIYMFDGGGKTFPQHNGFTIAHSDEDIEITIDKIDKIFKRLKT